MGSFITAQPRSLYLLPGLTSKLKSIPYTLNEDEVIRIEILTCIQSSLLCLHAGRTPKQVYSVKVSLGSVDFTRFSQKGGIRSIYGYSIHAIYDEERNHAHSFIEAMIVHPTPERRTDRSMRRVSRDWGQTSKRETHCGATVSTDSVLVSTQDIFRLPKPPDSKFTNRKTFFDC